MSTESTETESTEITETERASTETDTGEFRRAASRLDCGERADSATPVGYSQIFNYPLQEQSDPFQLMLVRFYPKTSPSRNKT